MNREKVKKESEKWVREEIITEEQAGQILALYPKQDRSFILMSFAGLFIGLGFLTFIASNWSVVSNGMKMTVLLFSMAAFYGGGFYTYQKKSTSTGASFLIIGLLLFGAGVFLTGQMYNYLFFSALPFLVWSLAAFVLYILFKHPFIFITSLAILTIGQIYSGIVYQQFDWWLALLLIFGFGYYTYQQAHFLYGYLFAVSFAIHAMVLTLAEAYFYYWLLLYSLLLYLFGDLVKSASLKKPFRWVGLGGGFLVTLFQLLFLTDPIFWQELERGWAFLMIWLLVLLVSMGVKWRKDDADHFLDYVLFLPIVYLGIVDLLSLVLLFVFSVGWLLLGYQRDRQEKIITGTISLLITTVSAYSHFAWDFMDRSLFFFTGGILLFILSFFLERRRRNWKRKETGGYEG